MALDGFTRTGYTVAWNLHIQEVLFPGVMLPVENGMAGEGEAERVRVRLLLEYGVE